MTGFHPCVSRWVISVLCQQGLLMLVWFSPPLLHSTEQKGGESLIIASVCTFLKFFYFLNALPECCEPKCLHGMTWAIYRTCSFISNINV